MAIEMESIINEFLEGSIKTVGKVPVINELNVSKNGTYTVPSGIDGYNPIKVNVPIPILDEITITSNGTYTPTTELKGYNKINVNVPLPDNGYILNIGSGAYISYNNGVVLNLQNLEVNIEPIQSGSGDPSPTNIRPISGWDKVNVTVADDDENPTVSNVYTIDLDGTRYGGKLDVVSGALTVDRVSVVYDGSENNWVWTDGYKQASINLPQNAKYSFEEISWKCNNLTPIANASRPANIGNFSSLISSGGASAFSAPNCNTLAEFKTWASSNNIQFCYELATPLTIQLTPTVVKSLLGSNNVWADTGSINNIEYFTK